ncbi:hypothetical protein C8R42DRAFT_558149, partial [Lentinula raphanica]
SWALFATAHAVSKAHLDSNGFRTHFSVKMGLKYWCFAVPRSERDFGSTDAFLDGYDVDMSNAQEWKMYGVLLRLGSCLIMPPCTPHFVVTSESSICFGGHFYCSRMMERTCYGILHTFVTSKLLTNTNHISTYQGLLNIMLWWHDAIVVNSDEYLAQLVQSPTGILPHKPNFARLDNMITFLHVYNLILLGLILDVRRY